MATPKRKKPEGISPQKRGGSKKVKQVSEKCILCHKEAKQDAVECQWCNKWERRACAGLSHNEYNMLSYNNSKIMFLYHVFFLKSHLLRKLNPKPPTKLKSWKILTLGLAHLKKN